MDYFLLAIFLFTGCLIVSFAAPRLWTPLWWLISLSSAVSLYVISYVGWAGVVFLGAMVGVLTFDNLIGPGNEAVDHTIKFVPLMFIPPLFPSVLLLLILQNARMHSHNPQRRDGSVKLHQ
jgi:hypothetical protein